MEEPFQTEIMGKTRGSKSIPSFIYFILFPTPSIHIIFEKPMETPQHCKISRTNSSKLIFAKVFPYFSSPFSFGTQEPRFTPRALLPPPHCETCTFILFNRAGRVQHFLPSSGLARLEFSVTWLAPHFSTENIAKQNIKKNGIDMILYNTW